MIKRIPSIMALAIILIVNGLLHSQLFVGISDPQELDVFLKFSEVSIETNDKATLQQLRTEVGGLKNLALYSPALLFYLLFSCNPESVFIFQVLISTLCVLAMFLLFSYFEKDEAKSFIYLAIWTFFPAHLLYSTSSIRVHLTLLSFLICCISYLADSSKNNLLVRILFIFASIYLWLCEPWTWAFSGLLLFHLFSKRDTFQSMLVLILLTFGGLFLRALKGEGNIEDIVYLVSKQGEFLYHLPLFYLSIASELTTSSCGRAKQEILFLMTALLVPMLLFAQIPSRVDFIATGSLLILLSFFMIYFIANFLSRFQGESQAKFWSISVSILGLVATLLAYKETKLIPNLDYSALSFETLPTLFAILSGIVFMALLLLPALIGVKKNSRVALVSKYVIGFLVIIANISIAHTAVDNYAYLHENTRKLITVLATREHSMPIYVTDTSLYQRLRFWGFDGEVQLLGNHMVVQENEGMYITSEDENLEIPSTWERSGALGLLGRPRLVLYRMHPYDQRSPSTEVLCATYETMSNFTTATEDIRFIEYPNDAKCLSFGKSLISLSDLTTRRNIEGEIRFTTTDVDQIPSIIFTQATLPVIDMRTSAIEVTLMPNTVYLFSAELRTELPIASLYVKDEGFEDYLEFSAYPDWTNVSTLLLTPDWKEAQIITISPFLFNHTETVAIRNLFFGSMKMPQQ